MSRKHLPIDVLNRRSSPEGRKFDVSPLALCKNSSTHFKSLLGGFAICHPSSLSAPGRLFLFFPMNIVDFLIRQNYQDENLSVSATSLSGMISPGPDINHFGYNKPLGISYPRFIFAGFDRWIEHGLRVSSILRALEDLSEAPRQVTNLVNWTGYTVNWLIMELILKGFSTGITGYRDLKERFIRWGISAVGFVSPEVSPRSPINTTVPVIRGDNGCLAPDIVRLTEVCCG